VTQPGQLVAAALLVVAACYAARLILPSRLTGEPVGATHPIGRGADLAGLLMAAGMAAMWSGSPVVGASTGAAAFTAMALVLSALWWHDGRGPVAPATGGHVLHHVVACLAMVYMYAAGGPGPVAASHALGAASGHHGGWWVFVSWLAGMYFLVAASSLGFRLGSPAPMPIRSGRAARRVTGYCDAAMSASMAAMLFTMA
jgi:Domain of unknown function (DUF5134)